MSVEKVKQVKPTNTTVKKTLKKKSFEKFADTTNVAPVKEATKPKTKATKTAKESDEEVESKPKAERKPRAKTAKIAKESDDEEVEKAAKKPKAKVAKAEKEVKPKAKVAKAEKEVKPKAEKKGSKSKVAKVTEDDDEVSEHVEKAPKAPKKVNLKPTLSDTQGLNISVAKVKNVISDLCINKEITHALRDIKAARSKDEESGKFLDSTFDVTLLSQETVDFLSLCHNELVKHEKEVYTKNVLKAMSEAELAEYNEAKKAAVAEFQTAKKVGQLFNQTSFDLVAFNVGFKADFYADAPVAQEWKEYSSPEEVYKACTTLVSKNKIRFNSDSKIFVTAFVEFIIKQLIINGTKNCIEAGKKIIKLAHGVDEFLPEFELYSFITDCDAYRRYVKNSYVVDADTSDEVDEVDTTVEHDEEEVSTKVPQFKYYVGELCRNVRMTLSAEDDSVEDVVESKFNQTSVSKEFKQFCSDVIIELLNMFGNMLKIEVITRDVKTVNYDIVNALVHNAHILHNASSQTTIKFIQDSYNMYNEFVKTRQSLRGDKKAAADDDEDEVDE